MINRDEEWSYVSFDGEIIVMGNDISSFVEIEFIFTLNIQRHKISLEFPIQCLDFFRNELYFNLKFSFVDKQSSDLINQSLISTLDYEYINHFINEFDIMLQDLLNTFQQNIEINQHLKQLCNSSYSWKH